MAEQGKIGAGTPVNVTTASGEQVRMIATSGLTRGRDFPVVWVTTPDDFENARRTGADMDPLPWPASDVVAA
ncbi:MAG TPA: hypothetical protein VF163_16340 [Micromonosporaceae bacterium]